ncbi:sporangiospore maturation cell wall hydrolase GsmA [Pilimelia columellifera]|uniref:Ig-like domain-containing protein n=1 Tax=Pilimelia columellifera subsp. columellifera TaxID=706583 RepID=A0ABN3NMF6_9ACTN
MSLPRSTAAGVVLVLIIPGSALVAVSPAAAAGAISGAVSAKKGTAMRISPTTSAKSAGALRNGARMLIVCSMSGQRVKGSVRTTSTWLKLVNGRYVSLGYVKPQRVVPKCVSPARTYAGKVRSADGPVRLRTGPSTMFAIHSTVSNGAPLKLSCQASGERIAGSNGTTTQWDRLTDGRWISHAYVTTTALPACTSTPAPPKTLTTAQFIAMAAPGAQRGWREYGVPPSVTIGQAILESGWGRSALSANHNNYFGIKCFNGARGPLASGCYSYQTFECNKSGACWPETATFRTYANPTNSFRDHGNFLRVNSRYAGAFKHTRNSNAFLNAIWKAGYATDPAYYTKVTSLMKAHNLYKYDTWK